MKLLRDVLEVRKRGRIAGQDVSNRSIILMRHVSLRIHIRHPVQWSIFHSSRLQTADENANYRQTDLASAGAVTHYLVPMTRY